MERFSLIRVRSPLLTESLLFSLPAGTEMFHFPAFPPRTLCVQMRVTRQLAPLAGFPHSDTLGSQSGYRLPQAYRRFLRPSSAPNAKASTVCLQSVGAIAACCVVVTACLLKNEPAS